MQRYAISDRALFGGDLDGLHDRLLAMAPHVDYIQVRERDLTTAAQEAFTRRLVAAVQPLKTRAKILVNNRPDIALASGADGVHLRSGPGEMTPAQVREIFRLAGQPAPVISIACHTLDEITAAKSADMIVFGPVFEKVPTPPQPPLPGTGLDLLRQACESAAPTPVFALGGVTAENQAQCLAAGARGIAGIRLFLRQSFPST